MPRDRTYKDTMYLLQQNTHQPAPGLGKTIGHGIDSGINPTLGLNASLKL